MEKQTNENRPESHSVGRGTKQSGEPTSPPLLTQTSQRQQPQKNEKIQRLKTGMATETSSVRLTGADFSAEVFKGASQEHLRLTVF